MKYPTISAEELERLTGERHEGRSIDVENSIKWEGTDTEIDLSLLVAAADEIRNDLVGFVGGPDAAKVDLFEGRASAMLHAALAHVPLSVLDDPGFWRYVGAVHLWELVVWRHAATYDKGWPAFRKYVDATNATECVAIRMFLRGRIAEVDGDYVLASVVERGADLWRSHIGRVNIGYSPMLSRELVRQVAEHSIGTDTLRQLAKAITRYQSNVVLGLYDEDQAEVLLDGLRSELGSGS